MDNNNPPTLLGVAIGDALGMPFETARYGDLSFDAWTGNYWSSQYHNLPPGGTTDDTAFTKILAESLIENNGFDRKDTADRYLVWFDDKNPSIGKTTKTALTRYRNGIPLDSCGLNSATNGSAMRAAPIGIFYRGDIEEIKRVCKEESSITHNNPEAIAGSTAVALGISFLLEGYSKKDLIDAVCFHLPPSSVKNTLEVVNQCFQIGQPFLENISNKKLTKLLSSLEKGTYVSGTINVAFLGFLATSSFRDSLETVIRAGGDTDTNASICGALASTFYEMYEVEPYLSGLENANNLSLLNNSLYNS